MFTSSIRMADLGDFDGGMVAVWFELLEFADLLVFSHTTVSSAYTEWCENQKHIVRDSSLGGEPF